MVNKKPSKPVAETRTTFMYPALHTDVVKAVSSNVNSVWYCRSKDGKSPENEYSTHIMGRFQCTNESCSSKGWTSKKVAILIKGYPGNGYNAMVYNQRCKLCNRLGKFTLDKASYVDRVAYRVQKWAGVVMEHRRYDSKGGVPHESKYCEGCKRGICRQGDEWDYD